MLDGRGISLPDKEIFRRNPDGFQGELTQYGGERPGQTAFNACEYRFLYFLLFAAIDDALTELKEGRIIQAIHILLRAEEAGEAAHLEADVLPDQPLE